VKSLNSVRIISVEEKVVRNALEDLAARLKSRPEVLAVYLCGSWARGNYTPYSDIDLLILITNDDRKPWERVPDYLPGKFPVGLDLFVYTPEELKNSRFARELLKNAIPL
jgi:predicted nucleotidyltransferase